MVNQKLVKRVKLRRTVAIITLLCGIAAGTIAAVAFAGRTPGSFTIRLKQQNIALAMDTHRDLQHQTTFLKVADAPQFAVSNHKFVSQFDNRFDDEINNDANLGTFNDPLTNITYSNFFTYTFYVKNVGAQAVQFSMNLNIVDNVKPVNKTFGYDDILRARVYMNDGSNHDNHEYITYAKRTRMTNIGDLRELVSGPEGSEDYAGYAEMFLTDTCICSQTVYSFNPGDTKRISIVLWLEGNDPECVGEAPDGGSLKLGIDIDGKKIGQTK